MSWLVPSESKERHQLLKTRVDSGNAHPCLAWQGLERREATQLKDSDRRGLALCWICPPTVPPPGTRHRVLQRRAGFCCVNLLLMAAQT